MRKKSKFIPIAITLLLSGCTIRLQHLRTVETGLTFPKDEFSGSSNLSKIAITKLKDLRMEKEAVSIFEPSVGFFLMQVKHKFIYSLSSDEDICELFSMQISKEISKLGYDTEYSASGQGDNVSELKGIIKRTGSDALIGGELKMFYGSWGEVSQFLAKFQSIVTSCQLNIFLLSGTGEKFYEDTVDITSTYEKRIWLTGISKKEAGVAVRESIENAVTKLMHDPEFKKALKRL